MKYIKIVLLLVLILVGCSNKTYINNQSDEVKIIINKININENMEISSIKDDVNGIVMFSEYKRPDEEGKIVIGAHSGYGSNAYFNNLHKLEIDDEIKIKYKGKYYLYEVVEVKEVEETETKILQSDSNVLILMTCKIGDKTKRTIVISEFKMVI